MDGCKDEGMEEWVDRWMNSSSNCLSHSWKYLALVPKIPSFALIHSSSFYISEMSACLNHIYLLDTEVIMPLGEVQPYSWF